MAIIHEKVIKVLINIPFPNLYLFQSLFTWINLKFDKIPFFSSPIELCTLYLSKGEEIFVNCKGCKSIGKPTLSKLINL